MTQSTKVLNYLKSGKTLNQGQAAGLLKVQSLSKVVSDLRVQGHCIYTVENKTTKTTAYRLGTPTKRMIALAYVVGGADMFN